MDCLQGFFSEAGNMIEQTIIGIECYFFAVIAITQFQHECCAGIGHVKLKQGLSRRATVTGYAVQFGNRDSLRFKHKQGE